MKRPAKPKAPGKVASRTRTQARSSDEFDATKRHAVTLTFLTRDRISPHELAQKLAAHCGGHALMPGEAIRVDHGMIACVVTDETLSLPHFSWKWHRSTKEPKRPKLRKNTCR
jgi:hypothetical protein